MRFEGSVALVTGAARGIGAAAALRFAAEGAAVGLVDVDPRVAVLSDTLGSSGRNVRAFVADVTDEAAVTGIVEAVLDTYGFIDILVNNAGIAAPVEFMDLTIDEWNRVLRINLTGTFICSQAVARVMIPRKRGVIVNLGSLAGKTGGKHNGAHYAVSKAGVMCLTKSMATSLAPYGIRVNAVAPGIIDTEMGKGIAGHEEQGLGSPLGRLGSAEEVAEVILFLASPSASYMTGEIVDVNGGILMD